MRTVHGRLLSASVLVMLFSGCAATRQVRYVYQDRDFGVIGMPENSDQWPTRYRRQAERMMRAHFPEGHEIVRAEEVVEGTRTLTVQGINSAEVLPALPAALLPVGRLGRTSTRSQADKRALRECRIVYRRVGRSEGPACYAPLATLTPTRYADPNAAERHPERAAAEAVAKDKESADTKPEPALELNAPRPAAGAETSSAKAESLASPPSGAASRERRTVR